MIFKIFCKKVTAIQRINQSVRTFWNTWEVTMKRRNCVVLLLMLLTVCLWQGRAYAVDLGSDPLSAVDSGYEIMIQQSAGEN